MTGNHSLLYSVHSFPKKKRNRSILLFGIRQFRTGSRRAFRRFGFIGRSSYRRPFGIARLQVLGLPVSIHHFPDNLKPIGFSVERKFGILNHGGIVLGSRQGKDTRGGIENDLFRTEKDIVIPSDLAIAFR